jgi:hypothetical protein
MGLLRAAGGKSGLVLIGPMPRYVLERCCDNATHLDNFTSQDYEEDILEAQEVHRHVLFS